MFLLRAQAAWLFPLFTRAEVLGFTRYTSFVVKVLATDHCPFIELTDLSILGDPHTKLTLQTTQINAICYKTYHIRHKLLQYSCMLNIASDTSLSTGFLFKIRIFLSFAENCMKR